MHRLISVLEWLKVVSIPKECAAVQDAGDDPFAFGMPVTIEVTATVKISDCICYDSTFFTHERSFLPFDDGARTSPWRWLSRHDGDAGDE